MSIKLGANGSKAATVTWEADAPHPTMREVAAQLQQDTREEIPWREIVVCARSERRLVVVW